MLARARAGAATALPDRPDRVGAYGVGFLIVESSPSRLLAQVSWWVRPDELYQRSFVALSDAFLPLETASIGGACELAVTAHEAGAWLRHVLANQAYPDIDGYLADLYSATAYTATAQAVAVEGSRRPQRARQP